MHLVLHIHVLFSIGHETFMFQVFHLTALVIRGPAARDQRFIINLERAAINGEEVRGVLLCVEDFVRSQRFTQRSFFSESCLTMLSESVAIAHSITLSSVHSPWRVVETAFAGQVVKNLCACWDRIALRRRTAKDSNERWYHGGTRRTEIASMPGVRFSDVAEEGGVVYVPVASPDLAPSGPSKFYSSPSERKRIISRSTMKLPRKFQISSPAAATFQG